MAGVGIDTGLARLKKLAETCEFGGYCEEAIWDRFVRGLEA